MTTINLTVSDDTIRGALCSAFEGGSNYWYSNLAPAKDNVLPLKDFRDGGSQQLPNTYWHWSQLMPLVEGCAVTLDDTDEGKTYRLDRKAIRKGLEVMARKFPKHFSDLVSQDGDATTGDVFLQCCLFGDVLYG